MKRMWVVYSVMLFLAVSLVVVQVSLAQNTAPLKVALIFDIGGRGDGGFNDSAYTGLEKAAAELGVKAVYVEHKRNLELDQAVGEVLASDAGMIIGVGFAISDKLNKLAAKYPDKKFVCVDYSVKYDDKGRIIPLPANLAGLVFKEEEGSYLVGAIAALKSKTGEIGFIGGMDSPIIRKFQAGYLAGARAVRPDIRVSSKYAGITGRAFNDPQKGYRIASRMYKEGADIIYHASGATGAGLFGAAKKMKRLAIGVDIDQSAQAPGLVLTSMTKHIDVAVFESVRSFVRGNFSGGLKTFGLKENGVGFVYNDQNKKLISADIHQKVLALQAKIIAGEVTVPTESDHQLLLSRKDLQDLLSGLHLEVKTALDKLDGDIKRSAQALNGRDLKSDFARDVLKKLYEANSYIIDCETVSHSGIMLVVEPPAHQTSEGADISKQAHMVKLFKTYKPVMSGSFRSVEGPHAVVIHHPVFSLGHRFEGSVSALFAPEYLLSSIIGPVASNLPVDIFLMQPDGLVIYDLDTKQIGLNAFTDPLYQPFPERITFARKVAAAPEGTGGYQFYRKDGEMPVTKVAYWQTIALQGTVWRLVIACAEDNIEK
ncbi:MAG: BMP family ABC transporter substrate-binding protein [Smithellaceae bacterium]